MKKSTLMLVFGAAIAFFAYRYFLKSKGNIPPAMTDQQKAQRQYEEYLAKLDNLIAQYGPDGYKWPDYDYNKLLAMEEAINQAGFVITDNGLMAA